MKTGIVGAGGSLKGMYNHCGFLLALEELGIDIDAAIGTSAGAIAMGYVASGGSPKKLREILINLDKKDYIDPISIFKIAWFALKKFKGLTGIIQGEALENYIDQKFPVKTFEETPIPFYAHTVNVSRRREEIFNKGRLAPAVRASASIPYVFQTTPIKDDQGRINHYWDGGAVGYNAIEELASKSSPVGSVRALAQRQPDLDVIIVNDFHLYNTDWDNSFIKKPWTPYYLLMRLLDSQAAEFNNLKYEILTKYDIEVITIRPKIPFNVELTKPSPKLAKTVIDFSIGETLRCFKEVNYLNG